MEIKCCNEPVKKGKKTEGGKTIFAYWCEVCGTRGKGENTAAALEAFRAEQQRKHGAGSGALPGREIALPHNPGELPQYVAGNINELLATSAAFIERPALNRMVKRNVKYVVDNKGQKFAKVWETEEGQKSVVKALEDSFALGATLPEMGSFVPYGTVCEFIPAVEAYEFALTEGRNAPFSWTNIEMIHKNDQVEVSRVNGHFQIEFKKMVTDRGPVTGVAVYGAYRKGGHEQIIGELYSAERLLEKAKTHSPAYRAYERNRNLYEIARTEGRTGTDAEGREYADVVVESKDAGKYADRDRQTFAEAEKAGQLKKDGKGEYAEAQIPKRDGGTWTKKIYRSQIENPGTETKRIYLEDLVNPYDGPDRPEMLRKTAGKSFLSKYVKVRNSVAAMEELRQKPETAESALDSALEAALGQFEEAAGSADSSDADPTGDGSGDGRQPRWDTVQADWSVEPEDTQDEDPELEATQGNDASGSDEHGSGQAGSKPDSGNKKQQGKEESDNDIAHTLF